MLFCSKNDLSLSFFASYPFKALKLAPCCFAQERKEGAFIANWVPDVLADFRHSVSMTWRLHTKLRKIVWHVSTNKSETMNHSNLRIGNIVFVLIAKNISFLWLLSLTVSDFIFCCVTKKTLLKCVCFAHTDRVNHARYYSKKSTHLSPWKLFKNNAS